MWRAIGWGFFTALLLAAVFVWPTEWAYQDFMYSEKGFSAVPVTIHRRTNRFTGEKQVYTLFGSEMTWRDDPL